MLRCRIGRGRALLGGGLLGVLTLFLAGLDGLLQIVSKRGAEGRIVRGVEGRALEALAAEAVLPRGNVELRFTHRKEDLRLGERVRFQAAQRRVIIQDVEAAPERAGDQVIDLALDRQVAHGDGRQPALEPEPPVAAVEGAVQAELRAGEKQVRIDVVLRDGQHRAVRRQVALDGKPGAAGIGALQQIRAEVGVLVVVKRGVHRARLMQRGDEAADVGAVRHAGELVHLPPGAAAVFRNLNQAIVRADVNQSLLPRRFGQGHTVAVERGRDALGDGVGAPDLAHDRQLIAIELSRQVTANGLPGVAAVVAAKELVRCEIEPRVCMGADLERRIPVPAQGRLALARLRLDAGGLARAAVEADQAGVLRFGVHDVWVLGIDARLEAVASLGDEPVGIHDAVDAARAGRAAEREVVLGAAVDVVKRTGVVHGDVVELRDRQIGHELPVGAAVEALVDAAVAAHEIVIVVAGVDPDLVIVDVLPFFAERVQRLATVVGNLQVDVHDVEPVGIPGIDDDVGVILGLGVEVVALLPGGAEVMGAKDAALLVGCLDDGVDQIGIRRGRRQADAAQFDRGQARLEFVPARAAVGRLVECALRTAVDQCPDMPAALVGGGHQHVGIARIEDHVGDAGVVADREHLLPVLTAVGGLVEPAVAAGSPERPLGGHVDDVRVPWVDDDLADMLGLLEAHLLPAFAAVVRAVDAVAVADAALAVVLPGADPDNVRVFLVQDDDADGV